MSEHETESSFIWYTGGDENEEKRIEVFLGQLQKTLRDAGIKVSFYTEDAGRDDVAIGARRESFRKIGVSVPFLEWMKNTQALAMHGQ